MSGPYLKSSKGNTYVPHSQLPSKAEVHFIRPCRKCKKHFRCVMWQTNCHDCSPGDWIAEETNYYRRRKEYDKRAKDRLTQNNH